MEESREDKALERSKNKIKRDVERVITRFFDHILDISEVAIGDPQRYKPFRSKVLRAGNDAIREAKKLLDRNYKVLYVPTSEDIIEIQKPTVTTRRPIAK